MKMMRPLFRTIRARVAHVRLLHPALVLLVAGAAACDSDPVELGPDEAVAPFVGTWEAEAFHVTSANDASIFFDIADGGSFTLMVEPSGHYTGILQLQGFGPVVENGRMEVESQTVILTPDDGPVATSTFHFDGADRVTLDGVTEFDFDQDGTPDPAEAHIVLVRTAGGGGS